MSEEILHNEQVLNTSCCAVTCDYVERFLNSVKLCKKNHRSDSKGCRPPPPRTFWLAVVMAFHWA